MSSFSVNFVKERACRYVFDARLWEKKHNKFGELINVLLDTGSFNTAIHTKLANRYGTKTGQKMRVSVGGYSGDADIYVLHKMNIGGLVLEKVIALAIPLNGELNEHILLGANVLKNWEFTVSCKNNTLNVTEQLTNVALARKYPYRYCFNNKGQIMAFQELVQE